MANDIDFEPLIDAPQGHLPLLDSALPFLDAVRIRVSVHVGSAEVTLASLVEMKPGTALALDRSVHQPVDLRVGEHVVARGVLVAVGDFFGVRIVETATFGHPGPLAEGRAT